MDPYRRIVAALSVYDMLLVFSYAMGTWMTPQETSWWGAVGGV